MLTVLLWPTCALGAFLGALIGAITGAVGDNEGGWIAIAWAVLGSIIGIAVAAGILGWMWAHVTGRTRWLPTALLTVLLGVGGTGLLVLLARVGDSSADPLRIMGIAAIAIVVTSFTFFIGQRTPIRTYTAATALP